MNIEFPSMNLDDALARYREPGTTIVLKPGEYITQGSGVFGAEAGLAPGVTLDASKAKIKLVDPVKTKRPWFDLPWLGTGSKVIGGEWDLGDHAGVALSGFRALGSCQIVGSPKLHGLLGRRTATDRHPVKEVFAFSQEAGTGGTVVEGLVATPQNQDPDNYCAGIYTNDPDSKVTACDMRLGRHGQFAYACTHRTLFELCTGSAMRFFYTDTGGAFAHLLNCAGSASWAGIGFAVSPGEIHRRIVFAEHCQIDASGARIVEFDDTGGAQQCTVVFRSGSYRGQYRVATNSPRSELILIGADVQSEQDHVAGGNLPFVL